MYSNGSSQIQYCPYLAALSGAEDYSKSGVFKDHKRLTRVSRIILSPFMAAGNKRIETRFIGRVQVFKELMLPQVVITVDVGFVHIMESLKDYFEMFHSMHPIEFFVSRQHFQKNQNRGQE